MALTSLSAQQLGDRHGRIRSALIADDVEVRINKVECPVFDGDIARRTR
jgi:hypothetical protein